VTRKPNILQNLKVQHINTEIIDSLINVSNKQYFQEVVMKHIIHSSLVGLLVLITLTSINTTYAQLGKSQEVIFSERNLGGPRLGVTYAFGGKIASVLSKKNIGNTLSQFGWHFEYQVIPDGGGPSFVIQMVPLVAGVEYGKLIPSGTLAMGIRFPEGFEFGMGPNLLVTDDGLTTALVLAVGKTINYGGVSIPLNIVFATNPTGNRLSFIFGYSIAKINK
jgi:hypothetical protein